MGGESHAGRGLVAGLKGKGDLQEAGTPPPAGPQFPQQLEEGSVSAKPPPSLYYKGLIRLPFLVGPSHLIADTPASPIPRRVTSSPPGSPPVLEGTGPDTAQGAPGLGVWRRCCWRGGGDGGLEEEEGFSRHIGKRQNSGRRTNPGGLIAVLAGGRAGTAGWCVARLSVGQTSWTIRPSLPDWQWELWDGLEEGRGEFRCVPERSLGARG